MIRFFRWLVSHVRLWRLTTARRLAAEWEWKAVALGLRLDRRKSELESIRWRLDSVSTAIMEDLEEAERLNRQHEVAIDALREENRVLAEVLVPRLEAADAVLLKRWDAEMAILTRNQVAAVGGRGQE